MIVGIPELYLKRKVMGIQPLEPAIKRIKVAPQPGNLDILYIELHTLMGQIEYNLNISENNWLMLISIPVNSQAEIWIPEIFYNVNINGKAISNELNKDFPGGVRSIYKLNSGIYIMSSENILSGWFFFI